MLEPIIASLTDPEAGMAEHLMQAQLLINERNTYRRACELLQLFMAKSGLNFDLIDIYTQAHTELENENGRK